MYCYQAGLHSELDTLARQFLASTAAKRDAIRQEASALVDSVGATYKHYLRVMEKLVKGSEEYLEKELSRYAAACRSCVHLSF
jgi:protein disulfide-isomerase A6